VAVGIFFDGCVLLLVVLGNCVYSLGNGREM